MKKGMKRVLLFLLAATLIFSLVPLSLQAEAGQQENEFQLEAAGNLKAVPYAPGAVKLTWEPVQGAFQYVIVGLRGPNGSKEWIGIAHRKNEFIDTNASVNEYNFYWVFPRGLPTDLNDPSTERKGPCPKYVYAKGNGKLPAPAGLKATGIEGGVKLWWQAAESDIVEGYLIYGIVNGNPYGYVGMTSTTEYIDQSAGSETWNFYWIFPYYTQEGQKITGLPAGYIYSRAK